MCGYSDIWRYICNVISDWLRPCLAIGTNKDHIWAVTTYAQWLFHDSKEVSLTLHWKSFSTGDNENNCVVNIGIKL